MARDNSDGGEEERDSSGVGGFGGFGRPGQRITEKIDPLTEHKSIERKANLLLKSIFLIELALFIPWLLAFLTFGYVVILVMVEAFIVVFFVGLGKLLEWRARTLGESEYSITAPFVACFIAIVLLPPFWDTIILGLGNRYRMMGWAMALTVYFVVIPIVISRILLVYRMGGEVSDQNPRDALLYPKFVWPWSNLGGVAHWNAPEPEPEPEPPEEQRRWMARTVVSARGQGSWSFYVPPKGISYLDVWHACQAISDEYDVEHNIYTWPGLGNITGLGSKKHYKLQNDWVGKKYAVKLANNDVVLLHNGIKVMEQVLSEPRPTRR